MANNLLGDLIMGSLLASTAISIDDALELPVGIITAIIGVPFFISLLRQRHYYGMQS